MNAMRLTRSGRGRRPPVVKVITVRRVKAGKEGELDAALLELRARGVYLLGYISGETLRGLDDPSLVVVMNTWTNVGAWKRWEQSAQRQEIIAKIEPLLTEPPKTVVFTLGGETEGAAL